MACQNGKRTFSHEKHTPPPTPSRLSDGGIRMASSKSELGPCSIEDANIPPSAPSLTCMIYDGAFIAQGTYPRSAMTISEYALNYKSSTSAISHHATSEDLYDRYIIPSIKASAWVKRGESGERRTQEDISVPVGRDTWDNFRALLLLVVFSPYTKIIPILRSLS